MAGEGIRIDRIEGLEDVKKMVSSFGEQSPKLLKITINETTKSVRTRLTAEIPRVFDNPRPVTKKAIRYETISQTHNRPSASVFVDDGKASSIGAAHWLWANIEGSQRESKASELRLIREKKMPAGKMMRPGPDAKLNQYGNVNSGTIMQALSQLRVFNDAGYDANQSKLTQWYYFADEHGIYRRKRFTAGRPEVFMLYVRQSRKYKKRFDFYGIGVEHGEKVMMIKANEVIDYALRNY